MNLRRKLGKFVLACSLIGGVAAGTTAVTSHADTIVKNNYHTKTVHSMYGDVKMKVKYDNNLTKKKSTITGIASLSNDDPYLSLVDKWYNSSTAEASYYDKTHKVYVNIIVSASECK